MEKLLDVRGGSGGKPREYLVKWEGYEDPRDNTWEPVENILCGNLVDDFEADRLPVPRTHTPHTL